MPRVIAEFNDRRIVRTSPRRDTMLYLEKKGQTNAMGEQQWTPITHCSEYPERNGTEQDDGETANLLRHISSLYPKTAEEK